MGGEDEPRRARLGVVRNGQSVCIQPQTPQSPEKEHLPPEALPQTISGISVEEMLRVNRHNLSLLQRNQSQPPHIEEPAPESEPLPPESDTAYIDRVMDPRYRNVRSDVVGKYRLKPLTGEQESARVVSVYRIHASPEILLIPDLFSMQETAVLRSVLDVDRPRHPRDEIDSPMAGGIRYHKKVGSPF